SASAPRRWAAHIATSGALPTWKWCWRKKAGRTAQAWPPWSAKKRLQRRRKLPGRRRRARWEQRRNRPAARKRRERGKDYGSKSPSLWVSSGLHQAVAVALVRGAGLQQAAAGRREAEGRAA